ncbi:MAG: hypothetical protein IKH88_03940 [Prevotella sp.]|nr:hypothetical protein [Prevotella sp.]
MSKNEETLYGEVNFSMRNSKRSGGSLWKKVGFGSVAGILLGAGALYGYDQYQNGSHGTGASSAFGSSSNVLADDNNGENGQNVVNDHDPSGDQLAASTSGQASGSGAGHVAATGAHSPVPHVVDVDDPNAVIYEEAPLADVDDDMTFEEAFAEARSEVGPGGVFVWHGGIYSTYNEEEWNSMSESQHTEYAQSVDVEILPEDIPVDLIEQHPDQYITVTVSNGNGKEVAIVSDFSGDEPEVVVYHNSGVDPANANNIVAADGYDGQSDDVDAVDDVTVEVEEAHFIEGDNVLQYGEVDGHEAAAVDLTGNDEVDVFVVDADDSHDLSDPDVMVFENGIVTTYGDAVEAVEASEDVVEDQDPGADILASTDDNPDVAPDMPDYIDDANILA